ncbi:hypothetical protein PG991_016298 [Apiospora marii]|uniref:Uncharacterized protein n=1 Tax=Apiospora marii TaxID=335849 RepID=A0ABR1QZP4_9PEZI
MELYDDLIKNAEDLEMMLQVLRWAVLAKDPTLGDWRYLLPFLQHRPPRSFLSCQWSEFWARADEDLADLICSISMGLVRITQKPAPASLSVDTIVTGDDLQHDKVSLGGRAGSLDSEQGETRLRSLIYRPVAILLQDDKTGFCGMEWMVGIRDGHLAILDTCISLIAARDLNDLVEARLKNGRLDLLDDSASGFFTKMRTMRFIYLE